MGKAKFLNCEILSIEELRPQLRTGDLLFCSGNYLVSELIKQISGSMFSHVAIVVIWEEQCLLMESVEDDGVRIVPIEHYLTNYENTKERYNGNLFLARHQEMEVMSDDHKKRCYKRDSIF
ncbi:YiiX/YebB-like N1pC/P60 family cysteine hydrolase [Bacillus sp. 2205SS5-2]|uniref:YiiX/YebB-like N1pC/P60 family cysteine hydrolase n=1 Tax=Bacillus sp. 2205SS5-2 TaxID=3109031 RepID=UPI0030076890